MSELPTYRSHKTVQAVKIAEIHENADARTDAEALILVTECGPVTVSKAYDDKHNPKAGGYYVRYGDGYESWSPAEAFEDGYTLVENV